MRVARHRQAARRERVRRRRRGLGVPPLRPDRRRGRRPGRRHRQPRRGQPDRARADRRLRPDHARGTTRCSRSRWKVAPCLAAGNTFVLKPSELTPHTAIHLMRLLEEAGLPAGVGNLVLGAGPEAGRAARRRTRGSTWSPSPAASQTGRRIMAAAAGDGEEGRPRARRQEPQHRLRRRRPRGRARLRAHRRLPALRPGLLGRRPAAGRGVDPRRVRRRARRPGRSRSGSAARSTTKAETGPLISAAHRDKVEAYVAAGVAEGAVLRCGGAAPRRPGARRRLLLPADRPRPAAPATMSVTQDESFGPVLTVETFTDEDEAVAIANDSIYGLAGAVWTQDAGKAAAGRRPGCGWARSGSTTTTPTSPQAEWGGYKQSGIGRELGQAGLDEYRETKHVWHNIRPPSSAGSRADEGRRWAQGPVRLRHRGWRLGRVRAGQPALRRPRHQRPGARGRPLGLEDRPVHPHAGRAAVPDRQPASTTGVRDRPRAGPERPQGLPRPRQGARRLVAASTG